MVDLGGIVEESPRNEAKAFAVVEAVGATVGAVDGAEEEVKKWDDELLVKLEEGDNGGVKEKEPDGVPNPEKPLNLGIGVEDGCKLLLTGISNSTVRAYLWCGRPITDRRWGSACYRTLRQSAYSVF